MLHQRHHVLPCLSQHCPSSVCPVLRSVPNIFLSFHKNTEEILKKFTGDNHYREQIKWLRFGRPHFKKISECWVAPVTFWAKLEQGIGSRMRAKIWIDVSRFCCDVKQVSLPSEWIHKFTAHTIAYAINGNNCRNRNKRKRVKFLDSVYMLIAVK